MILRNLDKGYAESMQYGMIAYAVPHRVWPLGYHCDPSKPLMMAALASQKNCLTVYLMSVYSDKKEREWFRKSWARSGKRLDMGGACIRFKKAEDAALDVIGEAIRRTPAKAYVANYVKTLASTGRGARLQLLAVRPAAAKATKRKATKKAAATPAPRKKAAKKARVRA